MWKINRIAVYLQIDSYHVCLAAVCGLFSNESSSSSSSFVCNQTNSTVCKLLNQTFYNAYKVTVCLCSNDREISIHLPWWNVYDFGIPVRRSAFIGGSSDIHIHLQSQCAYCECYDLSVAFLATAFKPRLHNHWTKFILMLFC